MTDQNQDTRANARQSYTGSRLTDSQFDEAWHIAAILNREIHRSGSFIEKLKKFAGTIAEQEKNDTSREEIVLRDIFSARYGESLNKTREGLLAREATLRASGSEQALYHANRVLRGIQEGTTMPFYKAYDKSAVEMAQQHGITETGAKSMMKEVFQAAEGRGLYETGKALEEKHHKPVREAEIAARRAQKPVARQADRHMGPTR